MEAHGSGVYIGDANQKFLRSLPNEWSTLAMTMRMKEGFDTWSIDDLYNNLKVFKHDIKGASKASTSVSNVSFVGQSKSSTCKVSYGGFKSGSYSTSSSNLREREVPAGFADEVMYSLFAKRSKDTNLINEDLEQIDDEAIEEMDINWQLAMVYLRMKRFYKKTSRNIKFDGETPVGFDKSKLQFYKCNNTGHFVRECTI